jgi:hypothetical protein
MSVQNEIKALRPKVCVHMSVDLRNEFDAACALQGLDMSSVLRIYIKNYVWERREQLAHLRSELKD